MRSASRPDSASCAAPSQAWLLTVGEMGTFPGTVDIRSTVSGALLKLAAAPRVRGALHHDSERVSATSSDPAATGPEVPPVPAAASILPRKEIASPDCTTMEPPAVAAIS